MPGTNPALRKKQQPSGEIRTQEIEKKKNLKKNLILQPFYQINKPTQMPSSDFFFKFFARNHLAFSFFSVLPHLFFFLYPSIVCLAKMIMIIIVIIKDRYGNPCAFLINSMVAGRMSNYAWGCKNINGQFISPSEIPTGARLVRCNPNPVK